MTLESNNHPNANNSFWLGVACLVFFAGGLLAAFLTGHWPPTPLVAGVGAAAIASGVVNIKNTFATNDNWKTAIAIISIIATVVAFVLPISNHSI